MYAHTQRVQFRLECFRWDMRHNSREFFVWGCSYLDTLTLGSPVIITIFYLYYIFGSRSSFDTGHLTSPKTRQLNAISPATLFVSFRYKAKHNYTVYIFFIKHIHTWCKCHYRNVIFNGVSQNVEPWTRNKLLLIIWENFIKFIKTQF